MSKPKSRAAEMRARRWRKNPIRAYKIYANLPGGVVAHHRVKPIDSEMKRWISAAEIRAAKERCAELNAS